MEGQKEILKVPPGDALRNRLRKEARKLVVRNKLRPPANMETLKKYASELMGSLGVPEEYTEFAIVLIGNETWRPVVSSIPYNRRLLLLPQCLRNNSLCSGEFDEFGLICKGCKSCMIDNILTEADELGYTSLVAEGTTVTMSLIEERSIDALIGLSCMSVLKQTFDAVSKAAIPVIGIPLLYDGCENTEADYNWILEEIKSGGNTDVNKIFSLPALNSKIKDYFSEQSIRYFFPGTGTVESLAGEMIATGGKRMRPLLTSVTYAAYSGDEDDRILSHLAMIIECFHKASLIHDDIEDNSDHRYRKETLHKTHGVPAAINAGDYLIGKGYQLLSQLPVGYDTITRLLKIISRSHIYLTEGQGADLKLNLKTCEAVKVALLTGAIAGGAPEDEIAILENFADSFGIAYQIKDDLNEFKEKREGEKINDFPFLIALLNEKLSEKPDDHRSISGRQIPIETLRTKIYELRIDLKAEEILQSYISECYATLDRLIDAGLRLNLYRIMGKVFKNTGPDD
jgi:geranylgeranyl pyrophosphate synthase